MDAYNPWGSCVMHAPAFGKKGSRQRVGGQRGKRPLASRARWTCLSPRALLFRGLFYWKDGRLRSTQKKTGFGVRPIAKPRKLRSPENGGVWQRGRMRRVYTPDCSLSNVGSNPTAPVFFSRTWQLSTAAPTAVEGRRHPGG